MDVAQEAWDSIKDSTNPADFDEFVQQFPANDRVPLAKLRAARLRRTTTNSVSPDVLAASAGLIGTWRGPSGRPFFFNGGGGIEVSSASNFDLPNGSPWKLEAWLNPADASTPQHVVGKRQGCSAQFYQIAIDHNAPGTGMGIDPAYVPPNTWTHVALVADGVNGWTVFANVALVKTVRERNRPIQNSGTFLIGGVGSCRPFRGQLDNVLLYNRALSPAEIQAEYSAGPPR